MSADRSSENHLILLTNHFPFGRGEAFLESEFEYLKQNFSRITVITKNTTDPIRNNFESVTAYRISSRSTLIENLASIPALIIQLPRILQYVSLELRTRKGIKFAAYKIMFHDIFKAITRSGVIRKVIGLNTPDVRITLYSYWLDSSALATLFVRPSKNIMRVARAHGGDIYEFRHQYNYLSFRPALIRELDRIFTISEDGMKYLQRLAHNSSVNKIEVARLGSSRQHKKSIAHSPPFTIVSCSFLLPVKRIHLIIQALSLTNLAIRWIHIGDGPLKNELEQQAKQQLQSKENISYEFKGHLQNRDLLQFYSSQPVHLFVNCSETEGIPVTIMEAQSFGIPVVAPKVGGIPEIISEQTGRLLDPDISPSALLKAVEDVLTLPATGYLLMRGNSYQNWDMGYNAEKNFPTFVHKLTSLRPV